MTPRGMARAFAREAATLLEEAHAATAKTLHHLVVRRSQEAVELALKAALILTSIATSGRRGEALSLSD